MDESSAFDLSAQNSAMASVGAMGRAVQDHNQGVKDSFKTQFAIDSAQHSASELTNEVEDYGKAMGAAKGIHQLSKDVGLARATRAAGQSTASRLFEMQPEIAARNIRAIKNKITQSVTGEVGKERSIGGLGDAKGINALNEETGLSLPSANEISENISKTARAGRAGISAVGGVARDTVAGAVTSVTENPQFKRLGFAGPRAQAVQQFADSTNQRAAAGAAEAGATEAGAGATEVGQIAEEGGGDDLTARINALRGHNADGTFGDEVARGIEPTPIQGRAEGDITRYPAESPPAEAAPAAPPPRGNAGMNQRAPPGDPPAEAATADAGTVGKDAAIVGKDAVIVGKDVAKSDTEVLAGNLLRGASKFSAGVGIAGGLASAGSSVYTGIEDVFDKGYFSKLNTDQKWGNVSGMIGGALDAASLIAPVLAPIAIGTSIFSAVEKTIGEHHAGDPQKHADTVKEQGEFEKAPGGVETLSSQGLISSAPVDIHKSISGTASF